MVLGVFSAGMVPMMVGLFLYIGAIPPLSWEEAALILCSLLFAGLVSLVLVRRCLAWASLPEFVIGKDGLWLRVGRATRLLHYEWKEVSYCHWSHFEPGVLNIQVGANPACSRDSLRPIWLFHRVPEAYRSRIEKAVRVMGKWREGDSDPVPDQAASWANDSTKVKAAAIDEIDGPPVLLVEIPRSGWKIVASFVPVLLIVAISGLFVWANYGSAWLWFDAVVGIAALSIAVSRFSPGQDSLSLRSAKTESGCQSDNVLRGLHHGACVILVCLPGKK